MASISFQIKDKGSNQIINDSLQVFEIPDDIQAIQFTVTVGSIFYVKARGNPSTGFNWFIDNRDNLDNKIIQLQNIDSYGTSEDFVTDPNPNGFLGVGGFYFFQIKAISQGNQQLLFVYKRLSKKDVQKIIKVKLLINPK